MIFESYLIRLKKTAQLTSLPKNPLCSLQNAHNVRECGYEKLLIILKAIIVRGEHLSLKVRFIVELFMVF